MGKMDNEETQVTTVEQTDETTVDKTVEETGEDNGSKKRVFPTQTQLAIRAIVGGYVLYLAYQIATSKEELTWLMWAAVAVFVVAGVALVIMSVKHFILGEYDGGRADTDEPAEQDDP